MCSGGFSEVADILLRYTIYILFVKRKRTKKFIPWYNRHFHESFQITHELKNTFEISQRDMETRDIL